MVQFATRILARGATHRGGFARGWRLTPRSCLAEACREPVGFRAGAEHPAAVTTGRAMQVLSSDSLLGADIATVGARLGPPLQCKAVGDEVHLGYAGPDGTYVADGIVLVDGVVVRERPVLRSPPSIHGYWIGKPIERVLDCFGPLVETLHHQALQELTFAAWRVAVHEGRVVMATPRAITRAS